MPIAPVIIVPVPIAPMIIVPVPIAPMIIRMPIMTPIVIIGLFEGDPNRGRLQGLHGGCSQ